jgi:ubiquitin-protein ligase E3 A
MDFAAPQGLPAVDLVGLNGVMAVVQESRTYWFNAASIDADDEFMLMGLVLGLAIYNAVLLDFPLPQALYRKLLGQSCTLRDLSDMDPMLGRSLGLLLAYDGEHSSYCFRGQHTGCDD